MAVSDRICRAIGERRALAFVYKAESRMAEPYILGHGEDGELTLSAYQLAGGSGRGFRFFVVDKMSDVVITETKFRRSRPEYNPRDRFFARVLCQVRGD